MTVFDGSQSPNDGSRTPGSQFARLTSYVDTPKQKEREKVAPSKTDVKNLNLKVLKINLLVMNK